MFMQKTQRIIRQATHVDMKDIMMVMMAARQIMRSSGNLHQWDDVYPSRRACREAPFSCGCPIKQARKAGTGSRKPLRRTQGQGALISPLSS